MNKHLAPVLGAVAVLGVVGGVAGAQFLNHPAPKPAVVHLVQQAVQVVTPSPTTTTVAPAPAPTPVKVVKAATTAAPVHSVQAVAPAPAPVQKAVAVSTDTSTSSPAPAPVDAHPVATPGQIVKLDPGTGPTGQFGPGQGTPTTEPSPTTTP